MLVKFSVKNYKQFKDEITFDLTAGNYSFNKECVNNKIVKTALIYGANGTGKTSLGWAIFDLVEHLTDNNFRGDFLNYYANALTNHEDVKFSFQFHINENIIEYLYVKNNSRVLLSESFIINGEEVISYNLGTPFETCLSGTEHLNKSLNKTQNLSVLKYILNNSNLDDAGDNLIFKDFMTFIKDMVWFQTLSSGMNYIGIQYNQGVLTKIVSYDYLDEFEFFLNENGVECQLSPTIHNGNLTVAFQFDEEKVPFSEIASTGTKHLASLFFWLIEIQENNVSLLFIDEFDSSYHFKLSAHIVKKLIQLPNTQVILTTHNTNLLSNDLIRPDCGFIINGKEIKALHKCTEKELREVHNLEKLYKAGAFHV